MSTSFGEGRLRRISRQILSWYRVSQRDLPWRHTRDPYRILVSEFMLQQTGVSTVVPYYERFISSYPSVDKLASADLDDVLAHWSGLGYYRRARSLHSAAREMHEHYDGLVPDEPAALRALPGVGEYTAAAVLSIAFNRPEAVLDGNVARVLSRLFAVRATLQTAAEKRRLQTLARGLLPPAVAGCFNQAMMELGAMICTPRQPLCESCPIVGNCLAKHRELTTTLPPVPRKQKFVDRQLALLVVLKGQQVLLQKKPEGGLLGGLWALPSLEKTPTWQASELTSWLAKSGLRAKLNGDAARIRHVMTNNRVTASVHLARSTSAAVAPKDWSWIPLKDLSSYAVPALYTKAIKSVLPGHKKS